MSTPTTPLPLIADRFKRMVISETAMRLNAAHGRRKMYSSGEVRAAVAAASFSVGWAGWPMAIFCTGPEFDEYCAAHGIGADYAATRKIALQFIDQPLAPVAARTGGAVAAGALAAGAVAAAPLGEDDPNRSALGDVLDLADTALDVADVAGGVFDVLGIFD
ncbi:MAG TPA: hypothetical protein VH105_16230 [Burkholderiales bacterium]|jgi:hypothetical protein|nr:hypothetical protein [Burkholderiales bacterium]